MSELKSSTISYERRYEYITMSYFFLNDMQFSVNEMNYSSCMFCYPDKNLIIKEEKNFILMKDKYPIIDNHYMIIYKNHVGCLGELPMDSLEEMKFLVEFAKDKLKSINENVFCYEHGRAGHCSNLYGSDITCHHFHLHLLSGNVDLHQKLMKRFKYHCFDFYQNIPELFFECGEYLFFENAHEKKVFYIADQTVESHLLRNMVCKSLELNERSEWENLKHLSSDHL